MFCDKCGKNNPDGMAFCEECGNPLGAAEAAAKEGSSNVKLIASIAAVVVALLVLIMAIIGIKDCVENMHAKPIEQYYSAMQKNDYDKIIDKLPSEFKKLAKERKNEIKEEWKSRKSSYKKEYGSNYKIKTKVVDRIKYSDDEVDDLEEYLNNRLGDDKIKLDDACQYAIRFKIKGSKDKSEYYRTINVYKIDGKWYSELELDLAGYGY